MTASHRLSTPQNRGGRWLAATTVIALAFAGVALTATSASADGEIAPVDAPAAVAPVVDTPPVTPVVDAPAPDAPAPAPVVDAPAPAPAPDALAPAPVVVPVADAPAPGAPVVAPADVVPTIASPFFFPIGFPWSIPVPVIYSTDHVTGVVNTYSRTVTPVANAHVEVLDSSLTPTSEPETSGYTGLDGSFTLHVPVNTQVAADRTYKLRVTYPDGQVLYYTASGNAAGTSTTDWAEASVGGPTTWNADAAWNVFDYVGTATNLDRSCEDGNGDYSNPVTSSTDWYDVCSTDPTVDDTQIIASGRNDAFDGIGKISIPQGESAAYQVTSTEANTTTDGTSVVTTLADNGVYLALQHESVDISVVRTLRASFVRWDVSIRDSTSHSIVDVPFSLFGNMGSDDATTWSGSGNWRTSTDNYGGDPVLTHQVVASSFTWSTADGDDNELITVNSGTLTYTAGMVDWADCSSQSSAIALAATIAPSSAAHFGEYPIGTTCDTPWVDTTIGAMHVGVPFDQTFTPSTSEHFWNWNGGGSGTVTGLPDGLQLQVLNENNTEDRTPPSFRIFGTPTAVGDFDIALTATGNTREDRRAIASIAVDPAVLHLTGSVLAVPATSAGIEFGFGIGDAVAGGTATVTAAGLKGDAPFDIVVRSTPQTLAAGTVPASTFGLTQDVTIPAGLETGWHSLTFSSTAFDGTPLQFVRYFQIGANGRLLATSLTAPLVVAPVAVVPLVTAPVTTTAAASAAALASTGTDVTGALALAGILSLCGVLLLARRRVTGRRAE